MCGRYQLEYEIDQLMFMFDAKNRFIGYKSKKEIFPTEMVPIITREGTDKFIDSAKWELKNHYDSKPLINARGETIDQKKTFKPMFEHGRCLIPATAFFEWRKNPDGTKSKMKVSISENPVFCMAGLYKVDKDELGNNLLRCTIITTSANESIAEIHDRMPVILPPDITNVWLDNSVINMTLLKELLKPYSGKLLINSLSPVQVSLF